MPATRPMITPKAMAPGEVKQGPRAPIGMFAGQRALAGISPMGGGIQPSRPGISPQDAFRKMQGKPAITPPNFTPITPKQRDLMGAGGPAVVGQPAPAEKPVPQTLYDFFKQDLEDQRRNAMADTTSNAASRGVYYGTPLTTSQGDIQTQYLRGLGQLQSGVLQNEQQNELSRLGLAGNLLNTAPQAPGGGIDPAVYQMLGTLFGGNSAVSGDRSGPMISPVNGTKIPSPFQPLRPGQQPPIAITPRKP